MTCLVALGFVVLTLAATWPLSLQMGSSLPSDYGDPLFVVWVMSWVGRHLTEALQGDLSAMSRMWDAPIFVPERHTLAYSEHFTAQAFQALPVYWLTDNPILAYNLVFLSTFALSALGAFVLVRELTGSTAGGAAAGAIFGFNVYRAISLSHLHTLSAQWVPFALAGLLVYARTGSSRALALAAVALVASNLSSGYYMAYCAPLIAGFAVAAVGAHGRLLDRRAWTALALAAGVVVAVQIPWILPYLAMQHAQQFARPRSEVEMSSLTLAAYRAAIAHLLPMLALSLAALLAWRQRAPRLRWAVVFFGLAGALAFWLSLGPTPRGLDGAPLGWPGLYGVLMDYVPGFDGLRVAGRFAMVLMLSLAVLAGIGVSELVGAGRGGGTALACAALAAHLGVYWTAPFPMNVPVAVTPLHPTPDYLRPAAGLPAIYRAVAAIEPSAVLVELPFGEPGYELRYMYFGLAHRRPLLNGYSGVFPASYRARADALRAPWADPDRAWRALAPATHVVVHDAAWSAQQRGSVHDWLAARGAQLVAEDGGSRLWRVPPNGISR